MDPYEQWKQAGMPGGSFEAWMAEQAGAPQAGQPQQPAQQQAPAVPGGNPWEWTDEQLAQAGIQKWGAEIGDKNRITANMTPEQRARWSMEHVDALDYRDRKSAYDQWMAWQDSYDSNCPPDRPYRAEDGSGCVEKPDNSNKGYMEAGIMDENGNWIPGGGGRNGKGGQGQNQKPPDPTTFGNQLSMTGNPMQDMLIQQFNTGQNSTYGQGNNLFGLGEDRAVGGKGANADMASNTDPKTKVQGQSLSGGGLWWGAGDETFKGEGGKEAFRADKKNSDEANAQSPGFREPQQQTPAAPAPQQNTVFQPGASRQVTKARPRNMAGMMYNQMSQNPLGRQR